MPRNVLFITADQWRADCLGVMGNTVIRTPNIDALAGEGVLFRKNFANISPCGPSRATIHTGMYGHNHRSIANGTPLDGNLTNLALEVRKGGREPFLFGYTDTSPDPRFFPAEDPRLLEWEGVLPGYTVGERLGEDNMAWLSYLDGLGYDIPGPRYKIYDPPEGWEADGWNGPTGMPARYQAEHSETAWLTERCMSHIRRHVEAGPDRPFFVHLSLLRPHPPWIAPAPYNDMYAADDMHAPIRPGSVLEHGEQHPLLLGLLNFLRADEQCFNNGDGLASALSEEETRQVRATYYGLISEVDTHMGRLLAFLKESGVYDDTLIIFTTDHGEQLGDHFGWSKVFYFDQSYHIPLIVRDPDRRESAGTTVDAYTESVDLMPTMLEWMGQPIPRQCNGRSLLPFVDGAPPDDWRSAAHFMFDFRDPEKQFPEHAFGLRSNQCSWTAVRNDDYKYVHFMGLPSLLFDLRNDPDELHNVADDPHYAPVLLECAQQMLSWRMEHENNTLANTVLTKEGVVHGPAQ